MPTFWDPRQYQSQSFTFQKLCKHTIHLLEDVGVTCGGENDFIPPLTSDIDGIDWMIEAILLGIKRWMSLLAVYHIRSQRWFSSLERLLDILNLRYV